MTSNTARYIFNKNIKLLDELHYNFNINISVVYESGFFKGCIKNSNLIKAMYYHEISKRLATDNSDLLDIIYKTEKIK